MSARHLGFAAVMAVVTGCGETSAPVPPAPVIDEAVVSAGPHNALSAIAVMRVRHADSVAVRFRLADGSQSTDSMTPAVIASEIGVPVPILGLLPERHYALRAVAFGAGGTTVGNALSFVTDSLPADLPTYSASGADPSAGYVVFASGMYGVVIDNTGRVVWYRRFPNGPWLNFMPQPNDRYVARQVTPDPLDVESWIELDPLGSVTRIFGCAGGLQPRFHDLLAGRDGDYWVLCDETRVMDLTPHGGVAGARVTGTAIQHVSAAGELLFHWSPFDHFAITDVDSATRSGVSVNWTHGNSLDLDADGNLLVSFRNLNEVTKIDGRTGAVLWRLGGRRNQFTFVDDAGVFAGQHGVRALGPDRFLLLDNIGDPLESRAQQWQLNAEMGEARLLSTYRPVPRVRTLIGGSVQPLPGGRTLVSYGTEGRVEEYDGSGKVVWRIEGTPGYVFRAQRIRSLYRPGLGALR